MKKVITIVAALSIVAMPLLVQAGTTPTSFSTAAHFIALTKIRRLFTLNAEWKAQLTLAIENGLMIRATELAAAGKTEEATQSLTDLSAERTSLHAQLAKLKIDDRTTHHLLADIVSDDALQLHDLVVVKKTKVAAKDSEMEVHSDIAALLGLTGLTADDRQIIAAEATSAAARGSSTSVEKLSSKINLRNGVEDVTNQVEVKDALMKNEENAEVNEAAKLKSPELDDLVKSLDANEAPRHNLVTLQELLKIVPTAKKEDIKTALNHQAEKEARVVETNTEEVTKLNDSSEPAEIHSAIIDRIKTKVTKEEVKNKLDSNQQQAVEEIKNVDSKDSSNSGSGRDSGKYTDKPAATASPEPIVSPSTSTPQPTSSGSGSNDSSHGGTPTATPVPSSTPGASTPTSAPSNTSGSLRLRDGKLDASTILIDRNSILTLQFENDDTGFASISLANGISAGDVNQNGKVNLKSFNFTEPLSFTVTSNGKILTGTILVK